MRVEKYKLKNATKTKTEEGIDAIRVPVVSGKYTYNKDTDAINGFIPEDPARIVGNKVCTLEYIDDAIETNTPDKPRLAVWTAFRVKFVALYK